jgi:cobaltochelatase CobS
MATKRKSGSTASATASASASNPSIESLFGVGPDDISVPFFDFDSTGGQRVGVPMIDDTYFFRLDHVRALMIWEENVAGANILAHGPTGSGKSSLIEQYCARIGKPVYRVACHVKTDFQEFMGQLVIKEDGSTAFIDGPLLRAMKEGAVFLADELNFLAPGVIGALNTVLDGGPLLVPQTGETVHPHPAFRFAATGNGIDGGSDIANYRGVQRMNIALLQRFLQVKVDYMTAVEEASVLAKVAPSIKAIPKMLENLVNLGGTLRGKYAEGALQCILTTRTLVRACRIVESRKSLFTDEKSVVPQVQLALNLVLFNGCNAADKAVVKGVVERVWPGMTI